MATNFVTTSGETGVNEVALAVSVEGSPPTDIRVVAGTFYLGGTAYNLYTDEVFTFTPNADAQSIQAMLILDGRSVGGI